MVLSLSLVVCWSLVVDWLFWLLSGAAIGLAGGSLEMELPKSITPVENKIATTTAAAHKIKTITRAIRVDFLVLGFD